MASIFSQPALRARRVGPMLVPRQTLSPTSPPRTGAGSCSSSRRRCSLRPPKLSALHPNSHVQKFVHRRRPRICCDRGPHANKLEPASLAFDELCHSHMALERDLVQAREHSRRKTCQRAARPWLLLSSAVTVAAASETTRDCAFAPLVDPLRFRCIFYLSPGCFSGFSIVLERSRRRHSPPHLARPL